MSALSSRSLCPFISGQVSGPENPVPPGSGRGWAPSRVAPAQQPRHALEACIGCDHPGAGIQQGDHQLRCSCRSASMASCLLAAGTAGNSSNHSRQEGLARKASSTAAIPRRLSSAERSTLSAGSPTGFGSGTECPGAGARSRESGGSRGAAPVPPTGPAKVVVHQSPK